MGPLKSFVYPSQSLRNREDSLTGSCQRLCMVLYEDPFPSQEIRKTGVAFIALKGRMSRTDGALLLGAFKSENKIFVRQPRAIEDPARPQSTALCAQAVTTAIKIRNTLVESSKDPTFLCEESDDASKPLATIGLLVRFIYDDCKLLLRHISSATVYKSSIALLSFFLSFSFLKKNKEH